MKTTYVWNGKKFVEKKREKPKADLHFVQPDLAEFRNNDGAHIAGRRQYREHLKATDTVELGASDVNAMKESWNKRQEKFQERLTNPRGKSRDVQPEGEVRRLDGGRIQQEVANRLHNRPAPDRKTLIQLTLQTARDLARRG